MRIFRRESKGTRGGGRFKARLHREATVTLTDARRGPTIGVEARDLLPESILVERDGRRLFVASGPHRSPTGSGVAFETIDQETGERATKTFGKSDIVDLDATAPRQTKTYFAGPFARYAPGFEPGGQRQGEPLPRSDDDPA